MNIGSSVFKDDILNDLKFNFKVLIVEDDDISFMLLEEVFLAYPINIVRAIDGEEAINKFRADRYAFDLVLMDIRLPKVNGYEATQRIKGINPSVPIIAVTACAHSQGVVDCFESGCDDFIAKPFDLKSMVRKVESYLVIRN